MDSIELLKIPTNERDNFIDLLNTDITLNKLIAEKEIKLKELQDETKNRREQLLSIMEKYDVKSIENDSYRYTRIEESTRVNIDSKKLKEIYPSVYDDCKKTTRVKPQLRITAKKENKYE